MVLILSTLRISSRGLAFGFSKRPRTNGDVFLTYKLRIIPYSLISKRETPSQQSSHLPLILSPPTTSVLQRMQENIAIPGIQP